MRKIILMGRSEAGKTTLTQALKGERITYKKTQYINHYDVIIDTPGEYLQTGKLGRALALYSYEADVVGLLASSTEPFSLVCAPWARSNGCKSRACPDSGKCIAEQQGCSSRGGI